MSFAIPMIHRILEWRKGSNHEPECSKADTETRVESINLPLVSVQTDSGSGDDSDDGDEAPMNDEGDNDEGMTEGVTEAHERPLLGLILTPTRELAVQVKHHIDAVAQFTGQFT